MVRIFKIGIVVSYFFLKIVVIKVFDIDMSLINSGNEISVSIFVIFRKFFLIMLFLYLFFVKIGNVMCVIIGLIFKIGMVIIW